MRAGGQRPGRPPARAARSACCQVYGGRAYEPQVEALKSGVDVVVGTPGRLIDLLKQSQLDLSHVKALVLDEADEMLDLGFLPDVENLLAATPASRQTMLFSATMPGAVIALARRYMTQPTHIRAADPDDDGETVTNITQHVYRAHALDKVEMLARILQADGRGLTMVFCRTKRTAAKVADDLAERGFAAGAVHGDLGQGAREQALRAFRNGKVDVLVATDVAARGIDVEGVTHVINYQCPEDEKTYLHRIGRTGRAGAKGIAVTFVDWDDIPRWRLINKALDLGFPEPVETYSTSPHLYEDLDIPEGTKGRLPRSQRTRAGLDAEELEDLGETGKRGGGRPAGGSHSDQIRGNRGGGDSRRGSESRSTGSRSSDTRSGDTRTASAPHASTPPSERPADESGEPREGGTRRRRGGRGRGRGEAGAENTTPTSESPANGPSAEQGGEDASAGGTRRSRNRRRTRSGQSAEGGGAPQASATEG